MTIHRIMTRQDGDLRVDFNPDDAAEVQTAMERFDDLVHNKKMWAVELGQDGGASKLVRSFDPKTDTLFMPQLVGG